MQLVPTSTKMTAFAHACQSADSHLYVKTMQEINKVTNICHIDDGDADGLYLLWSPHDEYDTCCDVWTTINIIAQHIDNNIDWKATERKIHFDKWENARNLNSQRGRCLISTSAVLRFPELHYSRGHQNVSFAKIMHKYFAMELLAVNLANKTCNHCARYSVSPLNLSSCIQTGFMMSSTEIWSKINVTTGSVSWATQQR